MTDTSTPIKPDEVPDPVFAEAMRVYGLAFAESAGEEATVRELRALRAAIAVALSRARDQIADAGPVATAAGTTADPVAAYLEEVKARHSLVVAVPQELRGSNAVHAAFVQLVHIDSAALVAAVEALLGGHKPVPLYGPARCGDEHDGPSVCSHDPDHPSHFESDSGEWLCGESREGFDCGKCREELIDPTDADWPCGVYTDAAKALLGEEAPS